MHSEQAIPHPEAADSLTRRALVLTGAGRYADPWHPFAETSAQIARILRDAGFAVEVADDVDAQLSALGGDHARTIDLLVVNVGNPKTLDEADADARAGLLTYLNAGGALLSMHVSATSFPGIPEWEEIMGGIWVRGTTMHPPADRTRIRVYPERHAIVRAMHDFEIVDERYSFMRVGDGIVPLASHEHDGSQHPLLWTHEYGPARVVYDALGHDADSFESPEHREIVRRAALWLVDLL